LSVARRTAPGAVEAAHWSATGMSLDLFDLGLDLEEQFGIEITREDFDRLLARRDPPDIRAADLYDLMQAKGPTRRLCRRCRHDLREHASPGVCPDCGTPFDDWDRFRGVLALHCNTTTDAVSPDSLLVRDFDKHW
jgi:hypothetical protein